MPYTFTMSHPSEPNLELDVSFTTHGRYYPATLEQPEEFPDIEVTDCIPIGVLLDDPAAYYDSLSASDEQTIRDACFEFMGEAMAAEADDYADYRYDLRRDQDMVDSWEAMQ